MKKKNKTKDYENSLQQEKSQLQAEIVLLKFSEVRENNGDYEKNTEIKFAFAPSRSYKKR
jgi:hypothetical protein